jgi:hypothetical protein
MAGHEQQERGESCGVDPEHWQLLHYHQESEKRGGADLQLEKV